MDRERLFCVPVFVIYTRCGVFKSKSKLTIAILISVYFLILINVAHLLRKKAKRGNITTIVEQCPVCVVFMVFFYSNHNQLGHKQLTKSAVIIPEISGMSR